MCVILFENGMEESIPTSIQVHISIDGIRRLGHEILRLLGTAVIQHDQITLERLVSSQTSPRKQNTPLIFTFITFIPAQSIQ